MRTSYKADVACIYMDLEAIWGKVGGKHGSSLGSSAVRRMLNRIGNELENLLFLLEQIESDRSDDFGSLERTQKLTTLTEYADGKLS